MPSPDAYERVAANVRQFDPLHPRHPEEPMEPLRHPNFVFAMRADSEGRVGEDGQVKLTLPATDLTAWERVTLVASIARALGLPEVDRHIRREWWWAS